MASLAVNRSYSLLLELTLIEGVESYLVIVTQQLVQKVDSLIAHEPCVILIDETMPALLRKPPEDIIVLSIQFNVVLVEIIEQIFCTEDLGNFDKLI